MRYENKKEVMSILSELDNIEYYLSNLEKSAKAVVVNDENGQPLQGTNLVNEDAVMTAFEADLLATAKGYYYELLNKYKKRKTNLISKLEDL